MTKLILPPWVKRQGLGARVGDQRQRIIERVRKAAEEQEVEKASRALRRVAVSKRADKRVGTKPSADARSKRRHGANRVARRARRLNRKENG